MKKICILTAALLAATTALAADKPQYGAGASTSAGMDMKTKPGDDFFRYANGAWLDKAAIPADKPARHAAPGDDRPHRGAPARIYGGRRRKAARSPPISKARSARSTRRSWTRRGSKRWAPRRIEPRARRDVRGREDARRRSPRLMGRSNVDFEGSLFRLRHRRRSEGPEALRRLSRPGRPRPAGPRLLSASRDFAAPKAAYRGLCREAAAPGRLARCRRARPRTSSRSRRKIAEASWTKAQQRDPVATYNPMTRRRACRSSRRASPGSAFLQAPDLGDGRPRRSSPRRPRSRSSPRSSPPRRSTRCRPGRPSTSPTTPRPISRKPFADAYFEHARQDARPASRSSRRAGSAACIAVSGGDFRRRRPLRHVRHDGLGRRPALHREVLPARGQGQDRGAGRRT